MTVVDEIKSRIDIVELISETVSLRKSGRTLTGFCPFHSNTRTPSFAVFPHSQSWHCFGSCNTGGDIFAFLMRRDNLSFAEALQELARRAGVVLTPQTPESAERDAYRQKLLSINGMAALFFHHQLLNAPQGETARKYLEKRSLTRETWGQFQLGYAPDEWEALKTHLVQQSVSEADAIAAGVLKLSEKTNNGFDFFRGRLMIPIRDIHGQTIGFGARALKPNDNPKYLNSPQSPIFDKGATLFGLDGAKEAIRQTDQVVIVEGYMDVMAAHQAGFANVVAEMGTALSEVHLHQLQRYTKNFVLALDPDAAGNAAALKGIEVARGALDHTIVPLLLAGGLVKFEKRLNADIRIAMLPGEKDPDELILEDPAKWTEIVHDAQPVVDYYLEAAARRYDLASAKGKSSLVKEVMPLIRELQDRVAQTHYLARLSTLLKIDENILREELNQPAGAGLKKPAFGAADAGAAKSEAPKAAQLESYLLAYLIAHPEIWPWVQKQLKEMHLAEFNAEEFQQGDLRQLCEVVKIWAGETAPQVDSLIARTKDIFALPGGNEPSFEQAVGGELEQILELAREQAELPEEQVAKQAIVDILRLRLKGVTFRHKELQILLADAQDSNSADLVQQYTDLSREYSHYRRQLEKARDAFSIEGQRRRNTFPAEYIA